MVIEQFLPGFHYGDAIGHSVLTFHKHLLKQGIESRIISELIDEEVKEYCTPFYEYSENLDSIKLYHYALASPMNEYFLQVPGRKAIIYHNITPPEYFQGYSEILVEATTKGREELAGFSSHFDIAIADSEYNAAELEQLGFENIRVFPIMISKSDYTGNFSKGYLQGHEEAYGTSDQKNIIFVGRVSPNKRIEDLIKFIALYNREASVKARLIIAGNTRNVPEYFASILNLRDKLGLTSGDLFFTGHIPFDELLSVYRSGDVFLSMSEHEGFCLPLVESAFFGLPVLAYDAGAVGETLKGSGILFSKKDYNKLVYLVERVLSDMNIRKKLSMSAAAMVSEYEKESDPQLLFKILKEEFDG